MATLTIRNLDEHVKRELRKRAAERGVSMEQEARDRLAESLNLPRRKRSILEDLRQLSVKPKEPIDFKKLSDELWDESLD
jgi:plasmid stability protein